MHMLKKEGVKSSSFPRSQRKGEWKDQRIPPSYPVVDLGQESWRTCLSNTNCAEVHNYEVRTHPHRTNLHPRPPVSNTMCEQILKCNNDKAACHLQAGTHPGLGHPAGRRPPRPRAGARERGLHPRRTWAAPPSPRRAAA